ncbi:MAG: site-specific integrase, partial [Acidimicrobiales bacterium]
MVDIGRSERDLKALVVRRVGQLEGTADPWEPYRVIGPDGAVVGPVSEYLKDLQAAGRSVATQRSYGMDLLRWFRFLWAVDVPWEQATMAEARDFCRWVQVGNKPAVAHWRRRGDGPAGQQALVRRAPSPNAVTGKAPPGHKYALVTAAHSETVVRNLGLPAWMWVDLGIYGPATLVWQDMLD